MISADAAGWELPPPDLVLSTGEVHVWRSLLDQPEDRLRLLWETLSPDERVRAERFHFDHHRRHFIAGRGFLRTVLGRYLHREAVDICFSYGLHGKPGLTAVMDEADLHFNLSHSKGGAILGLTRGLEIGIDVEKVRPLEEFEGIARRFFAEREVADLATVPPPHKEEAFFNCWTRKEAYVKACGEGLARPLDRFAVSLRPGEPAQMLEMIDDPAAAARWSLCHLTPWVGYVGCVAIQAHGWRLRCWEWLL